MASISSSVHPVVDRPVALADHDRVAVGVDVRDSGPAAAGSWPTSADADATPAADTLSTGQSASPHGETAAACLDHQLWSGSTGPGTQRPRSGRPRARRTMARRPPAPRRLARVVGSQVDDRRLHVHRTTCRRTASPWRWLPWLWTAAQPELCRGSRRVHSATLEVNRPRGAHSPPLLVGCRGHSGVSLARTLATHARRVLPPHRSGRRRCLGRHASRLAAAALLARRGPRRSARRRQGRAAAAARRDLRNPRLRRRSRPKCRVYGEARVRVRLRRRQRRTGRARRRVLRRRQRGPRGPAAAGCSQRAGGGRHGRRVEKRRRIRRDVPRTTAASRKAWSSKRMAARTRCRTLGRVDGRCGADRRARDAGRRGAGDGRSAKLPLRWRRAARSAPSRASRAASTSTAPERSRTSSPRCRASVCTACSRTGPARARSRASPPPDTRRRSRAPSTRCTPSSRCTPPRP